MAASSDSRADPTRRDVSDGDEPVDDRLVPRGRAIGRYLVIDRLGAGGMGEVFSAYDPELDRRVALKLLRVGKRHAGGRAQARLLREAQALAKLNHPNVVAVFDAGTHDARVFIAMEYVDGITLGEWIAAQPREWSATLRVLIEAGRGLAAAHAQGLVHRDFKPSNVMVRGDASACVLDFGLARRSDDPLESTGGGASVEPPPTSLTETGIVMGTPKFMAPEQFGGGSIDARTDQFAFCVVAWRSLFGVAPFPGQTYGDLSLAVRTGALTPAPREAKVPRAVRLALERGLAIDPQARFPDMNTLLAQLRRALQATRRRRLTIASAATVLLVAGAATAIGLHAEQPCRDMDRPLRGVWDDERRQTIAVALAATEVPYAAAAQERIEAAFDTYAREWVQLRTEACEATRERGEQSETLLDLRMACLDARLRELAALTDVLASADSAVVEHAVSAARNLRPLQPCADTQRLLEEVPRPADPAVAAEVAALREVLARARAEALTGRFDAAAERAEPVQQRARELPDDPLLAEAGVVLGPVHENLGQPEASLHSYEEALWAAARSGHSRAEAEALMGMASVMSNHTQQPELALRQLRHGRAVLQRLGDPPDLLARLRLYSGTALYRLRRFDEAEADYREALQVTGDAAALQQVRLAALSNLAASRGERGRYREAAEAMTEAVRVAEEGLGEVHPFVGKLYNNLAATYGRIGDGPATLANERKALAIYEAAFGQGHPEVGRAHHNLGVGHEAMGDLETALESYRRAVEIKRAALGPDDPSVAHSLNNWGNVLVQLGRPEEAIPLVEDAVRIWARAGDRTSPDAAYALVTLAEARLAMGEPGTAAPLAREALALNLAADVDPIQLARSRFVAAQAIEAAGGDRQEAIELARLAREGLHSPERDSSSEVARVDAWLAEKVTSVDP